MASKKLAALTSCTAGIILAFFTLLFSPITLLLSLIPQKNTRSWVGIALFLISTGCIFFLTLKHPVVDGLDHALKSTNVNMALDEEGEEFIQSLPLQVFTIGLIALIGSITVLAFLRENSLFNSHFLSPAKALTIIGKYKLMDGHSSFREINWQDVQRQNNYTDGEMLALAKPSDHPSECTPSSAIVYIIGLTPLLAGAYLAPVIFGKAPSVYWMDYIGGYFADAAASTINLFTNGHLNLRNTVWSIPVMLTYYGITGTISFRYAKTGYNALLINELEERHAAAKARQTPE